MTNIVRIKRRAATGAAGAPASLANAELAYNEADNVLYYGFGTGGANGSATQVIPIAGRGAFFMHADVANTKLTAFDKPDTALDINSQRIINVATPTTATDAANKGYVDSAVQGLRPKESVRAATVSALAELSGTMTVDGIALSVGDRVLVKNQTTASANGIYTVATGAWTRTTDANTWDKLISAFVFVEQGAVNADNGFLCTVDAGGVLGANDVTFVQFSGAGQISAGDGLDKTGNQLDVKTDNGIGITDDKVTLTGQASALHNLATNGMIARTASGTVAARTLTKTGDGVTIANGDGVAGNPEITLAAQLQDLANDEIDGAAITGGTISGAAITGGTIQNAAISGGTLSGVSLNNLVIDGGTF